MRACAPTAKRSRVLANAPRGRRHAARQACRRRVERPLAWGEKCKRLLRRFARMQPRHDGPKRLGDTLLTRRAFGGI
jgi:hypothetical protein